MIMWRCSVLGPHFFMQCYLFQLFRFFVCVTTSVQTGSDLANECHRHYEDGHIKLFSILRRERETINESKDYCWLTYDLELYVGNWNFIMSFSNNILMYLFISCIFWFSLNEYVYIMEPFLYIEAFCFRGLGYMTCWSHCVFSIFSCGAPAGPVHITLLILYFAQLSYFPFHKDMVWHFI